MIDLQQLKSIAEKAAKFDDSLHYEAACYEFSCEMNPRTALALIALVECYEEALKEVDKSWFDNKTSEWACGMCDSGDSGRETNPDGHDIGCPFSVAHEALSRGDLIKRGENE